jgi:methylmalonyl-CoA/ethylmalonyl-CoA epimerase
MKEVISMSTSIKRVNHVAIVVVDLATALTFWRDALGLTVDHTEENPGENVNIAFLPIGDSEIELLKPTDPDSGIGRYLANKGQGIHHICLEVHDIEATMQRLTDHGFELINDTPRLRPDGTRYAFVHPKSAFGVLVELYEDAG